MRTGPIMMTVLLAAGCGGTIASGVEPGEDAAPEPQVDAVEEVVEDPASDPLEDAAPDGPDDAGDCTELVWYQDVDHDGFGTNETTHTGCEPPPGYVDVGGDCDDDDWDAYPGQPAFFTEPCGEGSFDYNCDGYEEAQSYDLHTCSIFNCIEGEGWNEPAAPACGESGAWVRCSQWGPVCNYEPSRRTQACR